MRTINIIKKTIIPLTMAACLAAPLSPSVAMAKTMPNGKDAPIFVPFRDQIPFYLSCHSSEKSEIVKQLWVKVFYEELNWNSSYPQFYDNRFQEWWMKYGCTPYTGLGGVQKYVTQQITYSTGDFEAFLGNTLEANPEFLGQLLGLSGYDKLSDDSAANSQFSSVICTYLVDPTKYQYFSQSIVNLTKEGMYLDGSLNNGGYYKYMLATISEYYQKKDEDGNYYLSETQNKWVEGYLWELYKDYASGNPNALARKYDSIYDLIARSAYASNNFSAAGVKNGGGNLGKEFFTYVVKSGKGAGAWLNQNDTINISGLDGIDNLESLFNLSDGWCKGVEASSVCYNRKNCEAKATTADYIAIMLHKNSTAVSYINSVPAIKTAYGMDDHSGWRNRHRIKHTKYSTGVPSETIRINNIAYDSSSTGAQECVSQSGHGTGGPDVSCSTDTTIAVPLGKLPKNVQGTIQTVTVYSYNVSTAWYAGPNGYDRFCNEYFQGWSAGKYSKKVKLMTLDNDGSVKIDYSQTSSGTKSNGLMKKYGKHNWGVPYLLKYTFDISKLEEDELKNCVIYVTTRSVNGCYHEDGDGESSSAYTDAGSMPYVDCACKLDDCDINGHNWKGSATFSEDLKTATISYVCNTNRTHTYTTSPIETSFTEEADEYVYTVTSPYVLGDNGDTDTYSKRIAKSQGANSSSQTIDLNTTNTTGILSSTARSDNRIYPAGSVSDCTYKDATTTIKGNVKAGAIKPGASKISLTVTYSEKLEDLSIQVYTSRGKLISSNSFPNKDTRYTVDFDYATDSDLNGCYVVITGIASTHTQESFTPYHGGPEPDTAVATLTAKSMTVYY